MPTPRVNPDRVLTAAERQARRRELLERRVALFRETLEYIRDDAATLADARKLAEEALWLPR
ncbi:MAG TPA: hypothetical protein VGI78_20000 [Acetobacteraceae bacterium]|jgi:hypothetical protein